MYTLAGYSRIVVGVAISAVAFAQPQQAPSSPAQRVSRHFMAVNREVLEMAEDFPADKYDFRLTKEMRSFGEVIVHIASGNVYGSKAGRGEQVQWDELDPKNYKTKTEIVALMKKTIEDANAAMKDNPEGPKKTLEPWLSVMQHSSEHYGLLVAYYRANGLVPPASRPKK
jgi:hypothetical protein